MLVGDRVRRSEGTAGSSGGVSELSNIFGSALRFVDAKREEMMSNTVNSDSSGSTHKKLQSGEQPPLPYGPATVMPSTFYSVKDSGLILFTLAILAFTLYLSYYLWRKHRCTMAVLSKGCQYSRLNQTETDEIDSVAFCSEPHQGNVCFESSYNDHNDCKPATLEVITDSLVTSSNYSSSHVPNGSVKGDHSVSSIGSDLSDEDLLQ